MTTNSKKIFYSIGEVAEMLDVNTSMIRYWEKEFTILSPDRGAAGKRKFTNKDIENLKVIYHLLKERRMTIEGAKRQLKRGAQSISRDMEIAERLQNMRSLLLEIRQELMFDSSAEVQDDVVYSSVERPEVSVEIESFRLNFAEDSEEKPRFVEQQLF